MNLQQERKFNELIETVNAINAAICGDPRSGRDGIHKRMDKIEQTVQEDKIEIEQRLFQIEKTSDIEKTKVAAISAGICIVGTGIFRWLLN